MKGLALPILAGAVALAVVAAGATVAHRRQREVELSPLPSVENTGPRGLAVARAWLAATGRPARVLGAGDAGPMPGEVLLLVAPPGLIGAGNVSEILAHAERGGIVVWATGDRSQPFLERALGVQQSAGGSDISERAAVALAPHPLFDGIVLRTGGSSLRSSSAGALPVAGERFGDRVLVSAFAAPLGAGEAIVLAGPDALENFRLGEGGNLALLSRLSSAGRIAFDERHLSSAAGSAQASLRAPLLLAGQALLAAAVLLLALGRRLGGIRVSVEREGGRSARDYLASLGVLYRRSGGEQELRATAWRTLRRALERRGGIPIRATDEEALRRLADRSPAAAATFELGLAALRAPPTEANLVRLVRAAAELEASLARSGHPGSTPRRTGRVVVD